MRKRGRPTVPDHLKKTDKVYARVSGPMAEKLYSIARARRTALSVIIYQHLQSVVAEFETDEKHKMVVTH